MQLVIIYYFNMARPKKGKTADQRKERLQLQKSSHQQRKPQVKLHKSRGKATSGMFQMKAPAIMTATAHQMPHLTQNGNHISERSMSIPKYMRMRKGSWSQSTLKRKRAVVMSLKKGMMRYVMIHLHCYYRLTGEVGREQP